MVGLVDVGSSRCVWMSHGSTFGAMDSLAEDLVDVGFGEQKLKHVGR